MKLPGTGVAKQKAIYATWLLVMGLWTWKGTVDTWAQEHEQPITSGSTLTEADITQHLTMREAVQRAVEWYPSISETLGRLYQQHEQVDVARSGYFPQVDAGISSEYRTSSSQTEEAFNITASQLLYDFGKVSNDVKMERFGVEREQARVLLAIDQLALETAQTVIELQRSKALLTIAEEQVEGVSDIQALAEQRAVLGASTQSDQIQAQSRLEAAEATREQLQSQIIIWRNNLRRLTGATEPVSAARSLPDGLLQACELASEQFDNVPEIMLADAQREEARAQIARRQADFYPTLSAETRYNHYLNQTGNVDDDDVSFRLNLSSSLYQGGATRAQRRSADYALQAVESAKDNTLIELERSVQDAREQTRSALTRIEILEARASSIARTQELYRQQYLSLGTRTLLDLLNAEQEIHQSRFEQENARYDMYSVQLDCLYATSGFRHLFDIRDDTVQGVSLSP